MLCDDDDVLDTLIVNSVAEGLVDTVALRLLAVPIADTTTCGDKVNRPDGNVIAAVAAAFAPTVKDPLPVAKRRPIAFRNSGSVV